MANLYLIDGSNLAFRAHCAHLKSALTLQNGFPIGATFGTVSMLDTFVREWPVGKIVVAFDLDKSRYRTGLYPAYKGNRHKSKQDLRHDEYVQQLTVLPELLDAMGITVLAEATRGVEADDVIAYLVARFKQGAYGVDRVVVLSADQDLCALVGPQVIWYDPMHRRLITHENFKKEFGVEIAQYRDYKALKGDTSDNIQGAKGVGPKRAVELLAEYGSIDNLLAVKHARVAPHEENVRLAQKLVALNLHEQESGDEVWGRIDQIVAQPHQVSAEILNLFTALEFDSMVERWEDSSQFWNAFASALL